MKSMTLREHYVLHGTHARAAEDLDITPKQYQIWLSGKGKPGRWELIMRLLSRGIKLDTFPD